MSSQLIGKHIRFLEQSLGVKLINRTTRSQHFNGYWISFMRGQKIFWLKWRLLAVFGSGSYARCQTGKLRVECSRFFVVNALCVIAARIYDNVSSIKVGNGLLTQSNGRYIDEGFLNVAFRVGNLSDSGFNCGALRTLIAWVLCAAPHNILEHPTISPEPTDLLEQ